MSAAPNILVYAGEYDRSLDAKNRVTVPSRWRFDGDDGDVYLARCNEKDGFITIYPPEKAAELRAKMSVLKEGDEMARRVFREFFGKAIQFGCDAQGRIKIEDRLLKEAGIEKNVTLVGSGDRFEMWATEKYRHVDEAAGDSFDLMSALKDLGI